jgi:hypothetical protein
MEDMSPFVMEVSEQDGECVILEMSDAIKGE